MMETPAHTPQDDQIYKQQFLAAPKNLALQNPTPAQANPIGTPSRAASESFQELLALRQAYRTAFEKALARNQAMIEAIELAAEQVQDVRLTLLENGPEVDVNSVVFSLLVTFLLDSNLVGRMAAALVGGVLKPLKPAIQATIKTISVRKENILRKALEYKYMKAGINVSVIDPVGIHYIDDMLQHLNLNMTEWSKEATATFVTDLTGLTFKDSVTAAINVVRAIPPEIQDVKSTDAVTFGLDSPGVAFRRIGYNYLASLQQIYSQGMADINDAIAQATFDPKSSITILRTLKTQDFVTQLGSIFEQLQITLSESQDPGQAKPIDPTREDIRHIFSLEFEKAIWCLMYADRITIGTSGLSTILPVIDKNPPDFAIQNVDSRLANYWMMRFLDPQTGKAFENQKKLLENMKAVYESLNKIKTIVQSSKVKTNPIVVKFANPQAKEKPD